MTRAKPSRVADLAALLVGLVFALRLVAIVTAPAAPPLAQGSGVAPPPSPVVVHHWRGGAFVEETAEP